MSISEFFLPQSIHDCIRLTWVILLSLWPLAGILVRVWESTSSWLVKVLKYLGWIAVITLVNHLVMTPLTEVILIKTGSYTVEQIDQNWNEAPAGPRPEAFPLPPSQ